MSQPPATVDRILDTAEQLFAEHGFAETSLRSITSKAGVNLAAVNYHFGSKKALIQAVFARFLDPFMERLECRLNELEASRQDLDLEQTLELLVNEVLAEPASGRHNLSTFMRLMGLAYSQNQGHLKKYLTDTYSPVFSRYFNLLVKACPHLPPADMFWRTYFVLGSAVFSMSGAKALLAIAERDYGIQDDVPTILRRMVPFMAAGLRAHT